MGWSGHWDLAGFVALAVQADGAVRAVRVRSATSRRTHSSARAAGVEQHGDDRCVAHGAAVGGAFHRALLLRRERFGLAGARYSGAFGLQP